MRIGIASNIIKYYLKDVYFINGTAYAGKSTMVHMLAEKYGMIECGENYHMEVSKQVSTPELQPDSSYFSTMSGWEEFLNRTPEEYARWMRDGSRETAEFEIAELIRLSAQGRKIIVDTNISPEVLKEISDYNHGKVLRPERPGEEIPAGRDRKMSGSRENHGQFPGLYCKNQQSGELCGDGK